MDNKTTIKVRYTGPKHLQKGKLAEFKSGVREIGGTVTFAGWGFLFFGGRRWNVTIPSDMRGQLGVLLGIYFFRSV